MSLWIIGIGNSQRRDDGIGPFVAERLRQIFCGRRDIHIRAQQALDPVLLEDLKDAVRVVFVDATAQRLSAGWIWTLVEPRDGSGPFEAHDLQAPALLALLQTWYNRSPDAWMVAIQGEDFDVGEGLSPEARHRAVRVVEEIAALAGNGNIEC